MDVNQTRFHLVYGEAEWYPATTSTTSPSPEPLLDWDENDTALTLHQELFIFPKIRGEAPLAVENRRGSARDQYGNWYWIASQQNELRFLGASKTVSEHFWSSGDGACTNAAPAQGDFFAQAPQAMADVVMCGLAVTANHYLLVGLSQPKGFLILDLHAGGQPVLVEWPQTVPFAPFDITATADGGAWILDRVNKAYWGLDRYFRVRAQGTVATPPTGTEAFHPLTGNAQQTQLQASFGRITSALAVSLAALADPVAIETLPDGSLFILDNPPNLSYSLTYWYRDGQQIAPAFKLDHALAQFIGDQNLDPAASAVRGYDIAFVADQNSGTNPSGTLYIAGIEGEQVFAFSLEGASSPQWLKTLARYLPMRRFGGKALVTAAGTVYYDFEDRWWPLTEQPRARYTTSATLLLPNPLANASPSDPAPSFDGKQPTCVWHRLLLDACIPSGTQVKVESRAADFKQLLISAPWQPEPIPYLRDDGPEIPFYRSPYSGSSARTGTWESLFQNAKGRYLQLRLTLSGTGRDTPRLHALRIYYPRFSYLRQYLPAVYRDDAVSASFVDRYLANVEGFYTVLEGKIERVQALFDSQTVPAEYLDWLASWVGLTLGSNWSESTRRMVLSHAPQMFRQRGTRSGMIRAIRLGLDPCPDESLFQDTVCRSYDCPEQKTQAAFTVRVVERFLTRNAPGVVYGNPTDVVGPGSTTASSAWTPALGSGPLHSLFRQYLEGQYGTIASLNSAWGTTYSGFDDNSLLLPAVQPTQKTQAADWQRFLRGALGFTYAAVSANDQPAYRRFLARQYASIGALNAAYNLTGTDVFASFDSIYLPDVLPAGGRQLQDWIQFVSQELPTQQNAHRFTVLVPVTASDAPDVQLKKLGIAQSIAELEKPAHTDFDVRLYWGMFRAGEARIGLDTLLGQGSRSVALVLGAGYLAAGHLGFSEPWNVTDRMTIGGSHAATPCCGRAPQSRCT